MNIDEQQLQLIKNAIFDLVSQLKEAEREQLATSSKVGTPNLSESELKVYLGELLQRYQTKHDFKVGDVVKWKPGMVNRRFPIGSSPAIVVEVLTVPVMNPIADHGSPYFREILDLKIGIATHTGDLNTYLVESARFIAAD